MIWMPEKEVTTSLLWCWIIVLKSMRLEVLAARPPLTASHLMAKMGETRNFHLFGASRLAGENGGHLSTGCRAVHNSPVVVFLILVIVDVLRLYCRRSLITVNLPKFQSLFSWMCFGSRNFSMDILDNIILILAIQDVALRQRRIEHLQRRGLLFQSLLSGMFLRNATPRSQSSASSGCFNPCYSGCLSETPMPQPI